MKKTIKDAVIELNGLIKNADNPDIYDYVLVKDRLLVNSKDDLFYLCSQQEFQAEAKRMGYINGYEFGKEYAANGKRPELLDDVEISYELIDGYKNKSVVGKLSFEDKPDGFADCTMVKFVITDPRHKPVDEAGANALSQAQSLTHSEEGLTHSWHERGEFPPVGTECETEHEGVFVKCFIVGKDYFDNPVIQLFSGDGIYKSCSKLRKFRPIRTEREKFIEQAWGKLRGDTPHKETTELLGQLYDLGYRLPVEK